MKSNHVYNKMFFLINGELAEKEKALAMEHLASCKECSEAFNKLRITLTVIDDEKRIEPSAFLFSKIQNKIEAMKDSREVVYRRTSLVQLLKPVYISILIIFAVVTGMLVGSNLNIKTRTTDSKSTYAVNTTKDFYIVGVDDETTRK